ncbi:disease resistance RPP8-like protein 3 [Solanum pennellii]|uniref:Disease resistance RPP8-like protein 3 n=1 Tax=Solanum pennellii TaxID=28526 RepID=A0ABM1G8Z4_SOLPN|nr:disease resistance RPP8-like protein 3 [Solanum pennellii]
MSEIVLRSAGERLQNLLSEETAGLNSSVREDLFSIVKKLQLSYTLLKEKKRENEIENKVRIIEKLNYQIEDKIESSKTWRFLSFRIPKIKSKMETILKQIDNIVINGVSTSLLPLRNQITNIVGLEEDIERVCRSMLSDYSSFPSSSSSSSSRIGVPVVIPIYGVVGSGKTTLARSIHDNSAIVERFEYRIWIDVPHEDFDVGYILEKIMESVNHGWMRCSSSKKQLQERVERIFYCKRSLFVFDDVRCIQAWETLYRALPELYSGSYVLVTTRVEYVAKYISKKHSQPVHNMKSLNEGDSWRLFDMVLSPSHRASSSDRGMVGSCRGLPGLIKHLASSKKSDQNTQSFISEYYCLLYKKELPKDLQPCCFIYLGHFLENQLIDPEKLSHLWMIEGLLSTRQSVKGDQSMTERYLKELERMGVVELQPEEVPTTNKLFKAYRFVQGMEKFCVSNCEEKCFLKIIDLRRENCSLSLSERPRRLVIYLGNHTVDIPPKVSKTILSLRVVLLGNQHTPTKMLNLKEFKGLRVLDFDGIDFKTLKLLTGISNLKFLRYLSLKGCILDELPSSISKLSYLRVFDLRVEKGASAIKIPNVLWKLRRLKHLYLPLEFATQNGEKLRLNSLTQLETLVNFNTSLCRANDVSTLCKLHYLEAKVENNFPDFESITSYMRSSTSNKCPLHCSIDIIDLNCSAPERSTVLQEFLGCEVLQTLNFKGFIGPLSPSPKISPNLTQLRLHKSCLKQDPMPILEKLPSLGILGLNDDAYMGKDMVCSASGFPQLKCLQLLNLSELQRIHVENTAMPILSDIEIDNCQKLDINSIQQFHAVLLEKKTTRI